jgi:hypothetical protein
MKLFKGADQKENKNQKLSLLEKVVIKTMITFFKIALFKIGRAKTYGDLQNIINLIDKKFTNLEKIDTDKLSNEETLDLLKKKLTNLD